MMADDQKEPTWRAKCRSLRQTLAAVAWLALSALCLPSSALDPGRALTQYGHDVWTDQDGLPQNSFQAILQTSDGYIWMGTQEGLVRFDGLRFTVYNRRNTPAITSNSIQALIQDHEGTLWAAMETGGAVRYREGGFEPFGPAQGFAGDRVTCLAEDREHRIWFGTDGDGLSVLEDGKVTRFGAKEGLVGSAVYGVMEDASGRVWICTSRALCKMEGGRITPVDLGISERNWYYTLAQDAEGTVWVGSMKGLFALQGSKVRRFGQRDGLCEDHILSLLSDPAGNCLWVGTTKGLNRFAKGRFEDFTQADGLSNNSVPALCSDTEGNLWIGTQHGLNRLRDGKFYAITSRQGLPSDSVLSVCESSDGSLWVGTDGAGVARVKDGAVTVFGRKEGLPADVVNTLCPEPGGTVWVGVDVGGIASFRGGRFVPFASRDTGFQNISLICMISASDGSLWIGAGAWLYHVQGTKLTRFTSKEGLPGRSVNCLLERRDGTLVVGSDGGGLGFLREGKFTVLTHAEGLGSDMVYALYEDASGDLWAGTARGLSLISGGKVSTLTVAQGLFDDAAYVLLEDGEGFLWMSCNLGVYRARRADLQAAAEGRLKQVQCWSYGRADGMGTNECNGALQPSGWKMKDGRLCFATMKGVAIIDPASIRINDRPPPVVIEEVLLDGRDGTRFQHRFPPGKHRLEIQFSALSLVAPEKVRFKYRMEGFDSDWVDGGNRREAIYTGLPPGSYQFHVIACNNDGVWNEKGASFAFVQAPDFYQTGFFLVVCALAAILVIFGIVALRINALKRRQAALVRLVDERTVELAQVNHSLQEQSAGLQHANAKLERLSKEDGLTGIANRRHFEEVFEMEWRRAMRASSPLSVLMIDIDEFKRYNDALGHQQGDDCLRRVAATLASVLHRAGDLVARYGGDEFVAVLPTVDAGHALRLAELIRSHIEGLDIAHETSHGLRHVITVSVGVATATLTEGRSAEALLAKADRALYLAKEQGRNRVCSA